jgi:hypothetical protein
MTMKRKMSEEEEEHLYAFDAISIVAITDTFQATRGQASPPACEAICGRTVRCNRYCKTACKQKLGQRCCQHNSSCAMCLFSCVALYDGASGQVVYADATIPGLHSFVNHASDLYTTV